MGVTKTLSVVLLFTILIVLPVQAQLVDTEVELSITSDAFQGGIVAGQTGDVNINITNLGPNPIGSTDSLYVTPGYNITQDTDLFFEVVSSPTNDPSCIYFVTNADPRPPVDDILYYHSYQISADIAVGATYTCTITVTFEQPGDLETVWKMLYTIGNETRTTFFPFLFRGQALSVTLNINWALILLLLITTLFMKRRV